jgi:hypothetical protein
MTPLEKQYIEKLEKLLDWKKDFGKYVPYVKELESEIAQLKQQVEQESLAEKKYVKCTVCNGLGFNHYDDNNPCPICHGDGVIEQEKKHSYFPSNEFYKEQEKTVSDKNWTNNILGKPNPKYKCKNK